jgi:hypothetical protein
VLSPRMVRVMPPSTTMNIPELLSLLECLESGSAQKPASASPSNHPDFIGEYAIARCTGAGVHAGTVASIDGETVVLTGARRLWRWHALKGVALSGLAMFGLDSSKPNKIDSPVPRVLLNGMCELIPVSADSRISIEEAS